MSDGDGDSYAAYDATVRSPRLDAATGTVRPATAEDVDGMVQLAVAGDGRFATDARVSSAVERWRGSFTNDLRRDDRHLTVAEAATGLVGYSRTGWFEPAPDAPANTAPAGWYLIGLRVAPEWRRRGIARALTEERLDWVAARADEAWYFANAQNRVSLGLHASLGFVEVTRDFTFPGVGFRGGVGVLSRVDLAGRPGHGHR